MHQIRKIVIFFINLVVTNSCLAVADDSPKAPKVPSYFQAEIQITGTHVHSTYYGQIFYDIDKNQGMVIVENSTLKMQVLHNFDGVNNQTLLIQDNRTMGGLNEVPASCSFYDDSIRFNPCSETLLLLAFDAQKQFSPGYLLGITSNLGFRHDGYEEIGINSGLFSDDNVVLPAMKDNPVKVETYWYLGNSEWNFPNCPNSASLTCNKWHVPIKTIVSTKATCAMGEAAEPISVQYVYFNYKISKPDPTVFQIPQGVYCPSVESIRRLPKLEDGFTTGLEESASEEPGFFSSTVYYDGKEKMKRMDASFSPHDIDKDAPNEALIVQIYDYNTGVKYEFDPIKNTCLDVENITGSEAHTNLKDIYAVLADTTFDRATALYVGKRKVRGTVCDVWSIPLEHNTVLEVYLNETKYKLPDGQTGSRWSAVFVNQSFVVDSEEMCVARTFYNFEDVVPKRSIFDYISTCIPEEFKKRFQIEIKGGHDDVKKNPEKFIDTVTDAIAQLTTISVFRIQSAMLDYTKLDKEEFILFTATMLEDIYIAGGLETNEENVSSIVNNNAAYDILADTIYKTRFQVNFNVGGYDIFYVGTNIRDDIISTNPQIDTEIFTERFSEAGNLDLKNFGFDYQLVNQSMSGCAMECIESESVLCESFTYCTDKGSCKISHLHYENMTEDDKVANGRCHLYSRNYLLDFIISRNVQVKPTARETGVSPQAASPEQCARQCSRDPNNIIPFFCEGFDVCLTGNSVTCEFRSRHVLEIPNEEFIRNNNCSHFSRNYIADFLLHVAYSTEGAPKVITAAVSAPDCARLCSQQADSKACKAFEMCRATETGQKTKCKLLEYDRTDPLITLKRDVNCDYYSRERFGPPKHGTHVVPKEQRSSDKGYASGEMAGLGIGMIIVGCLLGAGIMILVMRLRLCCFAPASYGTQAE